jgi:hypothetical protein
MHFGDLRVIRSKQYLRATHLLDVGSVRQKTGSRIGLFDSTQYAYGLEAGRHVHDSFR